MLNRVMRFLPAKPNYYQPMIALEKQLSWLQIFAMKHKGEVKKFSLQILTTERINFKICTSQFYNQLDVVPCKFDNFFKVKTKQTKQFGKFVQCAAHGCLAI